MSLSRHSLVPALCAGLVSVVASAAAPAALHAQFNFVGSTMGCFWSFGPTPCNSVQSSQQFGGLLFTGNSFNATTPNQQGFYILNLGRISFTNESAEYTGPPGSNDRFRLQLNFSQPGSTTAFFSATVRGEVVSSNDGDVAFNFNFPAGPGGTQVIPFTTAEGSGTFELQVLNRNIVRPGGTQNDDRLTGRIAASSIQFTPFIVTPEPATIGLVASGILVLGGVGYRRRRQARD